MTDVFISYSRKDKAFVQVLNQALANSKYNAWVDWENIPLTADWWEEIKAGIEAADTFIFVISPDSIASKVCGQEIDHAVENNKRLVPILRREGFDMAQLRPALSRHNWLFFKEDNDFDQAFTALVDALNTDLSHVKTHTRLLVKAQEWDKKERREDLLLRGRELEDVIQWLTQNAEKEPRSTQLQRDYINAGRLALIAQQKAELKHQATVRKRVTRALMAAVGGLVISIGLGAIAFQQYKRAEVQRQEALVGEVTAQITSANALLDSHQSFDALLEILSAASHLPTIKHPSSSLVSQLKAVLYRSVSEVRERNRLEGHDSYWATAVHFHPDGDRLVSAGMDGTLKLWAIDGTLLQTFSGHEAGVYDLDISPDGRSIASASYDSTVRLWTLNGQQVHTWDNHEKRVTGVRFSPDGSTLATSSDDRTVKLIDIDSRQVKNLGTHEEGVHSLDWSPDGSKLISLDYSGYIKLWDKDGNSIATSELLDTPTNFLPRVAFSPDGQTIFTTSANSEVTAWSLDLEPQQTFAGAGYLVSSFESNSDGQLLAIAGEGNQLDSGSTIRLQNPDGNTEVELQGHVARINDLMFSPDETLLASAAFDGTVRLWALVAEQPQRLIGHTDEVNTIVFSPDGQQLASTSDDGTVRLWDRQGNELKEFNNKNYGSVSEATFSSDSNWLAIGYENGVVLLHNLKSGTTQELSLHQKAVQSVDFSMGQALFVSSSAEGTVKVVDLDGKVQAIYEQPDTDIYLARFSPDSKNIGFTFNTELGSTIALWRWETNELWTSQKQVGGFGGGSFSITDMAFNHDSSLLGTTTWEGAVHLWNTQAEEQASFFAGNDGPVRALSFAPDGELLAASSGGFVRLWTLTGEEVQRFYDQKRVHDISFSPDGNAIAAANADGTITLFQLDLDKLVKQGCSIIADYLQAHPTVSDNLTVCQS